MVRSLFLCLLAAGAAGSSAAQSGLWDRASGAPARGRSAVTRKVSAVKAWKQHLQDWGTDTSYTREAGVLGRLHSDGWAVGLYGARKSGDGRTLYALQLQVAEVVHEKQVKQQGSNTQFPELGAGTPYVFGKVANLYTASLMLTGDRALLPGVLAGTVSIGWRWGAGPSLALLKPYYLDLLDIDYSGPQPVATVRSERYTDANAELFLNRPRILGAGRWSQGLDEIQYVPGIQGELAVTVAPVRAQTLVPTLALGVAGAFYTKILPVLADVPAYPWQARLFAALQLGKRW